ncbi:HpcH/HpaI aldolase/citrate lyase family protein [Sphingomonas sp.]
MSTAKSPGQSLPPRSALYLPASNPRAIAKAATLPADMVILDLEDAVRDEDKARARHAAVAAADGFGERMVAIRTNGEGAREHAADVAAVAGSAAGLVVVPKVEQAATVERIAQATGKPVLAMIETPRGVLALGEIAAAKGLAGLIAGTNDLALELGLPPDAGRASMGVALQSIVLAARAHGRWAVDGVFNRLDDPQALVAECGEGRALGFDGKTLIHPNQIAAANTAFSPTADEVEAAERLIANAGGGAERHEGAMVESLHVEAARRLLRRARRA